MPIRTAISALILAALAMGQTPQNDNRALALHRQVPLIDGHNDYPWVLRENAQRDLDKLDDVASWEKPTASPTGIETVIVNGVVTLADGKYSGAKAGAVLRHGCGGAARP